MNKRIIIAAGGTLGHINPALVIARMLIKDGYEVYFFSSFKDKQRETFKNELYLKNIHYFNEITLNRKKIWKNFFIITRIKRVSKIIKEEVQKIKPALIIGMGGSISTLTMLATKNLFIKKIIHEQNAVMGLGNKIVSKKVDKILLSIEIADKIGDKSYKVVGNPIETDVFEKRMFGKESNEKIILIFGGSNGSKKMNDFFIDNRDLFVNYKVYLFTGRKYYQNNRERIELITNDRFIVQEKTNEMHKYYEKAYIVVSRGGATTISEIMAFSLISLVIPSPNVTNNHQYYNGLFYYEKGCIEMIKEKDLNRKTVSKIIEELSTTNKRKKMKQNIDLHHNIYSKYLFYEEIKGVLNEKT